MTSRLRKKPPTTALTFLAKACSTSVVAFSCLAGVTALAQVAARPHFREVQRGNPSWAATRDATPQQRSARQPGSRTRTAPVDTRPLAATNQEGSNGRDNASVRLKWRAPQLGSDEMPRRLPAAKAPVGNVAPRATDSRTATEKQEALIRLVSQIEEIEFPQAKQSNTTSDPPLQLPLGRDALASPESSLPAAPSPDDLRRNRATESMLTQPTAQQTPMGSEGLFGDEAAAEPDLGVLMFDAPPPGPVVNGADNGDQPQPPLEDTDNGMMLPAVTAEQDIELPTITEDGTTDQSESLPGPPAGLGEPPDFSTDALERWGMDDDESTSGETAPKLDLSEFKGRDCDAENARCNTARDVLARIESSRIRVDITPSILPLEVDMAKVREKRDQQLANVPARTWRDRQGNVLMEGTLSDFRDGQVYLTDQDGTVQAILPRKLSAADWCFVTAWWNVPNECRFRDDAYVMRDFRLTTFTWTADATCHKPLYFEEVYLERSGHTAGPLAQPFVSGAHFFGNVAMLPYHMGLNPPNECRYTLGHYRPGECAPWFVGGFPMSSRGLKWEGLAWAAAIALLP